MNIIENLKINEKVYLQKLENGLTVYVVPKKTNKKYIIWGAKYGSIDNKFFVEGDSQNTSLPDGIAHYLEHKLFEQKNGKNSLDVLCALGVDANAYTTNNHTAFLYECTKNFYEALDEFMDYVQNPYFTDENVEKERGIIGQEIQMYDDYPDWALYMNAIKNMYFNNEINIDVAGTKETIAKIDKEKLYKIYNSFYTPSNMVMVICGDFEPEKIIEEIKSRLTQKPNFKEVKRIYNEEPENIVRKYSEKEMDISMPTFMIGYKDKVDSKNFVKKDIAMNFLSNILFGMSTQFYKDLYEAGKLLEAPALSYEFADNYAHVLIECQTIFPEEVIEAIKNRVEFVKQNGIESELFEITKRKIYGEYVKEYNSVSTISTGIVANYFRGIDVFEYFDEFSLVTKEYVEKVLNEVFDENKMVISLIKPMQK